MSDYVRFSEGDIEDGVKQYVERAKFDAAMPGLRGRMAQACIDIMPTVIRSVHQERARMFDGQETTKDGSTVLVETNRIDDMLAIYVAVVSNVVCNLVSAIITEHLPGECEGCDQNRMSLSAELLGRAMTSIEFTLVPPPKSVDYKERKH